MLFDTKSADNELNINIPKLKQSRSFHSSCSIEGTCFVFGGTNVKDKALQSIESLAILTDGTPKDKEWSIMNLKNFTPRSSPLMVSFGDKVLIAGGYNRGSLSDGIMLDMF